MRDDSEIYWILCGSCEKTTALEEITEVVIIYNFYISSTEQEPNEWNE